MEVNLPLENIYDIAIFFGMIIGKILTWLLNNIGTLGMFVLTLFYVIYTKKIVETSKETVKQGEINIDKSRQPEVIVYFDSDKINFLNLIVENIGNGVANNISLKFDMVRGDVFKDLKSRPLMFDNGISFLAPKQKAYSFIGSFTNLFDEDKNFPSVKTEIIYSDNDGKKYEQIHIHDLNMYKGRLRLGEKTIHDLVQELEKVNKNLSKLSK